MKRILLAYDGSACGKRAAQQAADLARCFGAQVLVLSVAAPMESRYGASIPTSEDDAFRQIMEEGVGLVQGAGAQAWGKLEWGTPETLILSTAKQESCDLIVMGHRGHNALEALFVGSVAKHVIDGAHCSVLIVK